MSVSPKQTSPAQMENMEEMLEHFEQLETQLRQIRDGLTHSHRLATLGTIASIIAHEYNNILTPILSYGQLALAQPDNLKMMQTAVEKAVIGSERAARISRPFRSDTSQGVMMSVSPKQTSPAQMENMEEMLEHFEQLETQLRQIRDGLTHSHRLATLGTHSS